MPEPSVQITGLRELRRWLKDAAPDLAVELRNDLEGVAESVLVPAIKRGFPTGTQRWDRHKGRAKRSVKATTKGSDVVISEGGASVPYMGWLDFGGTLRPSGRRRNTQVRPRRASGRYLYPAVNGNQERLTKAAEDAVQRIIDKL